MDNIFNKNGCFYRALDDEPIFVLLARDPCFAEAVRWWVTLRQALIGSGQKPLEDHEVLAEALSTATAGLIWRNDATDPAKGFDAGEHARWHVEKAPERELVDVSLRKHKGGFVTGGHMLPYDEWEKVKRLAMPLGNRFLIGDIGGDLVLWENWNYNKPGHPEAWSGYYPVNNSLQKDMLWLAYEDWRNQSRNTVTAIKRLAGGEVPTYANILRRANELGTEGCPSELLTKYLLTFADTDPVTFYAGDIRKALEALRRERDMAGRPKTIKYFENAEDEDGREVTPMSLNRIAEMLDYATVYGEWDENTPNGAITGLAGEPMNEYRRNAIIIYKKVLGVLPEDYVSKSFGLTVKTTSGAGEIDPAKEALWIDMAEERGFLSPEDAEKARAALPEGTKAAVPSKHLTFIVRDLARKIATGLRQVTSDMDEWLETKSPKFRTTGSGEKLGGFMDRVNGYAAELEAGEAEAARFRSRPIRMHPALGAPYEPQEESLGNPYKRFASLIDYQEMTVEDARKIVEDFRKRFPDLLRIYDPTAAVPTMEEIASGYRRAAGIMEDAPLTAKVDFETRSSVPLKASDKPKLDACPAKAESDTLDVTDTPEMPPHRFTMFTKARGWAYGRGLEINPAHIPDMLDRMDSDGWHLQAVFGGVEPTKVGMLFKRSVEQHADFRKPWEWIGSWCGKGLWVAGGLAPQRLQQLRDRISAGERLYQDEEPHRQPPMPPSVAEMMAAPTEGVDDLGRGLEP